MSSDRDAALSRFPVSRETESRIDAFLNLFKSWQTRTNLVAPSTLPTLWTRHIADSLQLLKIAPDARSWLDIGSGGGFPGIILAIVLADRTDAEVHLVERNGKKAAFLREALRVSGGAGQVHYADILSHPSTLPAKVDLVTARAVASLKELLEMSAPWLTSGATGLFLKGQDVVGELKSATIGWDFAVQHHASRTGPGSILEVSDLRRRQPIETARSS